MPKDVKCPSGKILNPKFFPSEGEYEIKRLAVEK